MVNPLPDQKMAFLTVLAEPSRLAIVEHLREGPKTVNEIAESLGFRQPQASKHLKILLENGILEMKAEANRRIYSLAPQPFIELKSWIESYDHIMEQRFNKLDNYLQELQKKGEQHHV